VVVQHVVVHVRGDANRRAPPDFCEQVRIPCESDTRIDVVLGGGVQRAAVSVLPGQSSAPVAGLMSESLLWTSYMGWSYSQRTHN